MTRVSIGSGRWFDLEGAVKFSEAVTWDGHNWISVATGSQFDHEEIVHTRRGGFLLHYWSQWEGVCERYERISAETVAQWLVDNQHVLDEHLSRLPVAVRREVRAMVKECEV